MPTLALRCACGAITGAFDAAPEVGSHGVCYCDDCQAYARWLGRDDILNERGGTEVVQTWPARVTIEGEVALMHLRPKGLFRWYAPCCRVPLANSFGHARAPFLGLIATFVADRPALDTVFGPAYGVQGRFAPGGCPPDAHRSASLGVITDAAGLLARGAWRGAHSPHPLLRPEPRALATVLEATERAALYR